MVGRFEVLLSFSLFIFHFVSRVPFLNSSTSKPNSTRKPFHNPRTGHTSPGTIFFVVYSRYCPAICEPDTSSTRSLHVHRSSYYIFIYFYFFILLNRARRIRRTHQQSVKASLVDLDPTSRL